MLCNEARRPGGRARSVVSGQELVHLNSRPTIEPTGRALYLAETCQLDAPIQVGCKEHRLRDWTAAANRPICIGRSGCCRYLYNGSRRQNPGPVQGGRPLASAPDGHTSGISDTPDPPRAATRHTNQQRVGRQVPCAPLSPMPLQGPPSRPGRAGSAGRLSFTAALPLPGGRSWPVHVWRYSSAASTRPDAALHRRAAQTAAVYRGLQWSPVVSSDLQWSPTVCSGPLLSPAVSCGHRQSPACPLRSPAVGRSVGRSGCRRRMAPVRVARPATPSGP